jgi:TonB family protein
MHPTAAQSLLARRPSRMGPFVAMSLTGHAAVVGGFLVLSWVLAGPRIDLDPKPIKASLVRLGKKRDEKLLPRIEATPPPAEPTPAPVVQPKPDQAKTKPDVTSKDKPKTSLADAFKKTASQAKPEELEGDPEGDKFGDSATQEGERYFGLLSSAVRRYYDVSNTIEESERLRLKAQVTIKISHTGEVLDVDLNKKSGNEVFDSAVLAAVKKAAPFPPPPPNLRDQLKKGLTFEFKP